MREWLKEIRLKKKFTQEEFAEELLIARTTYAMYELGERTPSVTTAKRISEEIGVDWTIFFTNKVHETCS